jgi:hypothetical protein
MKALARSYCWWPNINNDIERIVKNCAECQKYKPELKKVQTHIWEPAMTPFERIHIDFAGEFLGKYFLVIVDSYSKWIDVKVCKDITSKTTIRYLREFFTNFGICETLVSDHGSQLTSNEFQSFLKMNGVIHKMGAPYKPSTNGQAERYVQTFKQKLKSLNVTSDDDLQIKLNNILMQYRKTPHPVTGKSPSEMVFGRQIRSRIDLLIPKKENKIAFNVGKEVRELEIDQRVICRDYLKKNTKWQFGKIKARIGKLHYLILLDDGREWHVDQIRPIGNEIASQAENTSEGYWKFGNDGGINLSDNSNEVN